MIECVEKPNILYCRKISEFFKIADNSSSKKNYAVLVCGVRTFTPLEAEPEYPTHCMQYYE